MKKIMELSLSDQGNIILKKYVSGCIICGDMDNVINVNGEALCEDCIVEGYVAREKKRKLC